MAIENMSKVSLDLERFADLSEKDLSALTRKLSLDVLTGVVTQTPVDTGRARGAWLAGSTLTSETPERLDSSGGGTIASGASEIATASFAQPIYVQNNVSYIRALENGHSQQAPQGMVAVTISNIKAKYNI